MTACCAAVVLLLHVDMPLRNGVQLCASPTAALPVFIALTDQTAVAAVTPQRLLPNHAARTAPAAYVLSAILTVVAGIDCQPKSNWLTPNKIVRAC